MKFNDELFLNSILQLIISIFIGTIILYSTYKLIDRIIRKKNKIKIDNTAYGILCSSILFSVGFLIAGIKDPIINSINLIQQNVNFSGSVIFEGLKYTGLFLSIIIFLIWIIIIVAIYLFTIMTKNLDEFKEIKNNNIAVSLIIASIVMTISFIVKSSLFQILESFVPYPNLPSFS